MNDKDDDNDTTTVYLPKSLLHRIERLKHSEYEPYHVVISRAIDALDGED